MAKLPVKAIFEKLPISFKVTSLINRLSTQPALGARNVLVFIHL